MGGEARRARRGDGRGKKRRGAGEGGRKKEGRECMGEGPRGAETCESGFVTLGVRLVRRVVRGKKNSRKPNFNGRLQSFTWK